MSTLSLAGSTHAISRHDFEQNQEWPDTPQNRRLLAAYGVSEPQTHLALVKLASTDAAAKPQSR